jgi:hypothetical protein
MGLEQPRRQRLDCGTSSSVRWARYDHGSRVLEIDFRNTKTGAHVSTYAYSDVPAEEWEAFTVADNKGRFFAYRIRMAKDAAGAPLYPFRKIS